MRRLRAFLLGTLGVGLLAYVSAAALALAAGVGGGEFDVRVGPLAFVAVDRGAGSTSLTLGVGLVVVAFAGGIANVGAAMLLARRARDTTDRIH